VAHTQATVHFGSGPLVTGRLGMISRIRPAAGASSPAINRRHSEAIHKSVSSPHRRNTRRPTLNIAAIYNNLIAYNLISVAVWVCGRIDLEKSK